MSAPAASVAIALAPRVDAEPVAELGAAVARVPAQDTEPSSSSGSLRRVIASVMPRPCGHQSVRPAIHRPASETGYGEGTAIR